MVGAVTEKSRFSATEVLLLSLIRMRVTRQTQLGVKLMPYHNRDPIHTRPLQKHCWSRVTDTSYSLSGMKGWRLSLCYENHSENSLQSVTALEHLVRVKAMGCVKSDSTVYH